MQASLTQQLKVHARMQKEFLQGQVGSSLHSFDLGRMTDLSLGLYQDSGWYDVKVCPSFELQFAGRQHHAQPLRVCPVCHATNNSA